MNGKEYQSFHYFDKRTNEEDMPVMLPNTIQDKYEQLEVIFEEFFDDNSLSLAKVSQYFFEKNFIKNNFFKKINFILFFLISKAAKRNEIRKVLTILHLYMVKLLLGL